MFAVLAEDKTCKKWPETCSFRRFLHPQRGVGFEQVFVMHGENAVHREKTVLKNRIVTSHNSHGLTF